MRTEVILLENCKYGKIGDVISVASGFARNYLIPKKKALRCTFENKQIFEAKKAAIEVEHKKRIAMAQELVDLIKVIDTLKIKCQTSEDGKLYGSVTEKDVIVALSDAIGRQLGDDVIEFRDLRIRAIGLYKIEVALYSSITTELVVEVMRA